MSEENPMSAATPRTISNAPDLRQLLAAVGALILAVALLVAVTFSRQASFQAATTVAEPASVSFDHGWSSAATSTAVPSVNASTGFVVASPQGGILYMGIPYTAPVAETPAYIGYPSLGRELIVRTESGGLRYTGIPYPAPDANAQDGVNGMQRAQ